MKNCLNSYIEDWILFLKIVTCFNWFDKSVLRWVHVLFYLRQFDQFGQQGLQGPFIQYKSQINLSQKQTKHIQIQIFSISTAKIPSSSNESFFKQMYASSQILPEQVQPQKAVPSIMQQLCKQQGVTLEQMQVELKQFRLDFKNSLKEMEKMRRQIQLRPTSSTLMQNTILINTAIHSDPMIVKLLHSKQSSHYQSLQSEQTQQTKKKQRFDPEKQLEQASVGLGKKLSQVNQALSLLLGMIKALQKQSNHSTSELKSLIQQKTHSLQDQLTQSKMQEITERLNLSQKVESSIQEVKQKQRQFQSRTTYEFKDFKNKLSEKISKELFYNGMDKLLEENKSIIKKFQQQTTSLVNPQKIQEIQKSIQENNLRLMKEVVDCNLKVENIQQTISNKMVSLEAYKKERTHLQKRISTINTNFEQFYTKTNQLLTKTSEHSTRLTSLQTLCQTSIATINQMKTILKNLSITEKFQEMLSQIDPQKILALQNKIVELKGENKQLYFLNSKVNEEIDKIYSKFDVAGVMVPNKSRQKEYHLNDLKEIIDSYWTQNRFSAKLNKIESDLNQAKFSVQSIKTLQKRLARLQKQSEYTHILQNFVRLEETVNRTLKAFEQKVQSTLSQNQQTKSYFQGILHKVSHKKLPVSNSQIESTGVQRRKSLVSESTNRLHDSKVKMRQVLSYRSNSMKKINPWNGKQTQTSFFRNTVSSTRKNLLKSSDLLTVN